MHSLPSLRLLAVASASLLATGAAVAQSDAYSYVGISAGQSRSAMNAQDTADRLLGAGVTTGLRTDLHDTGYKALLGYQFNRYIGTELSYFDLGHFNFNATTAGGALGARYRMRGVGLDLVGTLPLSERWSAIARIGVQGARTRASFDPSGSVTLADTERARRDTNVKVGAGLQYAFGPSFLVRVELERYRMNDAAVDRHAGVNLVSLGLIFPFGRAPQRMQAATPSYQAPMPVAQAAPAPLPTPMPAPVAQAEPVPMVAMPAPTKRRVTYSAESLFTFDESAIRPEGRVKLDDLVRELTGTTDTVISVEGHTDRLGTTAYNQALSLRRAEAVKNYLVTAGRLMPDRISVLGLSESKPVTTDCVGTAPTAQLKACLQPDRRVEIEVTGAR